MFQVFSSISRSKFVLRMKEQYRKFQISTCLTKNFYLAQTKHNATKYRTYLVSKVFKEKLYISHFSFHLNPGHTYFQQCIFKYLQSKFLKNLFDHWLFNSYTYSFLLNRQKTEHKLSADLL